MGRKRRGRAGNCWLLLLEPDGWQLVSTAIDAESLDKVVVPPERLAEQAPAIVKSLQAAGWRKEPVVAALAAEFCLAATIDVPTPAMLRKPQAMRFHLEGWLPWSAEEFVADYVPHKNSAFMVATAVEPLQQLLAGLEEFDVAVAALTPSALLPLDRHLGGLPPDHVLTWGHEGEIELYVIEEGRPRIWRHAVSELVELSQFCGELALELSAGTTWYARGLDDDQARQLVDLGIPVTLLEDLGWRSGMLAGVEQIAVGRDDPLVNLRRDDLAGQRPLEALASPMRRLKWAAALALLGVCGGLWIVGDRHSRAALTLRQQAAEVYATTFPQDPVPTRIVPAMRKAYSLLQGTRGPVKALPQQAASDQVLQRILAALPVGIRYRVPEIRVEGSTVYVAGEVRSNADADQITAALRAAGFETDSPRTQRLPDQGFSVRLAGKLPEAVRGGAAP